LISLFQLYRIETQLQVNSLRDREPAKKIADAGNGSGEARDASFRKATLYVLEERHEPEIHVQLLVTVKERRPRIVRDEVKASS
jgi:hypothetical protein